MTSRTWPVVASAMCICTHRRSREVDRNASCLLSALQIESARVPSRVARLYPHADAAPFHINNDPMDLRNHIITRHRVFPGFELRMPRSCADEIGLRDAALILLEGGDPLGIRRPKKHGSRGRHPPGIVGGVTKILHAITRHLDFVAGLHLANPQVEIANESHLTSIRRWHLIWHGWGALAAGLPGCAALPPARIQFEDHLSA